MLTPAKMAGDILKPVGEAVVASLGVALVVATGGSAAAVEGAAEGATAAAADAATSSADVFFNPAFDGEVGEVAAPVVDAGSTAGAADTAATEVADGTTVTKAGSKFQWITTAVKSAVAPYLTNIGIAAAFSGTALATQSVIDDLKSPISMSQVRAPLNFRTPALTRAAVRTALQHTRVRRHRSEQGKLGKEGRAGSAG